jgi:uncharacterized protein YkwD
MNLNTLIDAHNVRRQSGLWTIPLLEKNTLLMEYAQKWAVEMSEDNKLHHSKMTNILALGFKTVGENIASGQESVESVMKSWMNSWGHRKNIMSKSYTNIGCGYATFKNGTPYWCVCFGTPSNKKN